MNDDAYADLHLVYIDLQAEHESVVKENERLRDALEQIEQWIAAYPETVFVPVSADQMQRAAHVLREAGISMDALHAGWARQILDGLRDIVRHAAQEA